MIENIFVFALGTVLILMVWLVFGLSVSSFFSRFKWYNKIKFIHKFKIPKRYKSKVTPIYELVESDWDGHRLVIKKWSLQYYEPEIYQILSLMLIYPTKFLRYGYQFEDSVFLCLKKDIESLNGTLEENYERIWGEQNKEYQEEVRVKNTRNKMIEDLNKTFLENFE